VDVKGSGGGYQGFVLCDKIEVDVEEEGVRDGNTIDVVVVVLELFADSMFAETSIDSFASGIFVVDVADETIDVNIEGGVFVEDVGSVEGGGACKNLGRSVSRMRNVTLDRGIRTKAAEYLLWKSSTPWPFKFAKVRIS
jgi:hypothetical protein